MAKITVSDFIKKVDSFGDDIPVEVRQYERGKTRSAMKLIATSKSLFHYYTHSGLEAELPLESVTIRKDVIVLYVR